MKKILILLALVITLQLLVGDNPSWELQYTSTVEQLQMLRQSAGMIYGVGYKYFVKSNDGLDFQNIMVDNINSLYLESAHMVTPLVGYCGGSIWYPANPDLSRPVLYKTTNGGQTWTRTYQFEDYTSRQWLKHIQFVSETEGYIVIEPFDIFGDNLKIYRTTNAGQTWSQVFTLNRGRADNADFTANLMVIGVGLLNGVLVSTDGLNWQLHQNGLTWSPSSVLVSSNRLVIGVSTYLYSDDLGNSWSEADTTGLGGDFGMLGSLTNCVMSVQDQNIYAVGATWDGNNSHPGIIRSLNNGTSWNWLVQPVDMPDQSGQTYGICYWGEYLYIAHNLSIYRFQVGSPVNNDDPVAPALDLKLTCYPNPFRGSTNIKIEQTDNSPTTITVYNLRGQLIRTVVNSQKLSLGEHLFTWDGKNDNGQLAAAGIYLFKMKSGSYSATRKMILMK